MEKKKPTMLIIVLILIAAVCGIFFITELMSAEREITEYTGIQTNYTSIVSNETTELTQSQPVAAPPETAVLPYTVVDFDALLTQNAETVGRIAIPDTIISYPVVQAADNNKYLGTSFTGEKSRTGAVFADHNNNMAALNQNTVLYAHNMGHGRTDMFGTLLYFNNKAYYDKHQYIQFDTIYERHGWWRISAVINYDTADRAFHYLKLDFENQSEFMDWAAQAKGLSLYNSGVDVSANDRILTLSTCDGTHRSRLATAHIMARMADS